MQAFGKFITAPLHKNEIVFDWCYIGAPGYVDRFSTAIIVRKLELDLQPRGKYRRGRYENFGKPERIFLLLNLALTPHIILYPIKVETKRQNGKNLDLKLIEAKK